MTGMLAALVVISLAPPQGKPAASAPAAIVVLDAGAVVVTVDEVGDAVRALRQSGDPKAIAGTLTMEGVEQIAREVLDRKLLAREARTRGVSARSDVARAVDRAVELVLAEALLESEVRALDTSEPVLRQYYEAHPEQFRLAPRRKAHHIVVKTRAEAEAALAELRAGAPFEALAAAKNIDNSAAGKGDLGWVGRGVMVKSFEDALFALGQAGELSGVVQTSFGFHVIRVDDVDPGSLPPFELIQDRVRQVMATSALERLRADLVARHPATPNRDALRALLSGKR